MVQREANSNTDGIGLGSWGRGPCVREGRLGDLPKLEEAVVELHLSVFAGRATAT